MAQALKNEVDFKICDFKDFTSRYLVYVKIDLCDVTVGLDE